MWYMDPHCSCAQKQLISMKICYQQPHRTMFNFVRKTFCHAFVYGVVCVDRVSQAAIIWWCTRVCGRGISPRWVSELLWLKGTSIFVIFIPLARLVSKLNFQMFCYELKNDYHYINDAIMSAIASKITSLTNVYSTVYSDADQRKHQSSASLAFVRWIHRWAVNSPHRASNAENASIWCRHHDFAVAFWHCKSSQSSQTLRQVLKNVLPKTF